MKILSITAGAAGMYCGSCFRDNAVAAELLRRGHDVVLMPVYTPTRTDEENVSRKRQVLLGGINVYLQQRSRVFRRLPRIFDRLIDAPFVIRTLAGRSVGTSPATLGDLTISTLQGLNGPLKREFEKIAAWMQQEPVPDVINLPNSMLIAMAAPLAQVTGRPICCTLQGEELFLEGLPARYRDEAIRIIREKVPTVDHFVAVSEYCARFMSRYFLIPPEKISVVPLGISFDGYRPRSPAPGPKVIGYFARVAPEKGLHALAESYIRVCRRLGADAPVLEVAGYMAPSESQYLDRVKRQLADQGLEDRLTYRGELDREGKIRFLQRLDVLSVPATYDEPKGMFLLEAMACGVPVVQPHRGAFVEIIERTGGGLLVEPDNAEALADGLMAVVTDARLATELGQKAFSGVRRHYGIDQSVTRLLDVYGKVIAAAHVAAPDSAVEMA